jgi:hypothetical protein
MTALRVVVDAAPLPDEDARAFWKRFSDWMQEHPGDLSGFAQTEGLASVHPEMHGGTPVLVASHTAEQRPYTVAPDRPAERRSPGVARPRSRPGQGRARRPTPGGR